ncbi:hypothetical protein OV320_1658 [Actinobacteria bacterium OV320]|nr:hypothetical protein OV320_1658 [Actinobacteria bacterium OV320]
MADRESFAAAAEVAVACGWRYAVAARWREHAFAGLHAMASRRRLRSDPLGLRPVLLAEAAGGRRFAELAAATGCEPVARAQLLHLAVVPPAGRRPGRPAPGPLARDALRGGGPVTAAAVLDLSPGAGLVLDGTEWTVERREPHLGRVHLVKDDGTRERVTFRFLANHPQCSASSRTSAAGADQGRQRKVSEDLKAGRLELTELRMAHLLEAATGFRSGDPFHPGPGEPRTEYDPAHRAPAREGGGARALDPAHAKLLGLSSVGYRTLIRWENARRRFGLVGCADDHWLRRSGGTRTVSEEVREAVLAVREETKRMAKVSMRPSYDTLRRLWQEWFGPGGARQRYARSADLPAGVGGQVLVHRPGQVVALDTTVLPVMVREHVFGDPVKMHLTLALDVCTHSLVAFRLTLVSDTSVDVAMVLRDVTMPLPMRADWGKPLEWPYPGLPAQLAAIDPG